MTYTVKELARLAGVSARTLHHYDAIGLLRPESRTEAGYRLYGANELKRLQQILFFKELDFELPAIAAMLDSPGFDEKHALQRHRELLLMRRQRLDRLLDTVDSTLNALKGDQTMNDKEYFENFDMSAIDDAKAKYAKEVDEKYPGWRERDKTKRYGKQEWAEVTRAGQRIQEELAALMDAGKEPCDAAVQAVINRHFHYIDSNFYDCSMEIYEGLSDLYVSDSRFTGNIDKTRPGLAEFQSRAMKVYCKKN